MRGITKAIGGQLLSADDDGAEFVISSDGVDRDGDRIDQDSLDFTEFDHNPVATLSHDLQSVPVGKWLPESRRRIKIKDPASGEDVDATAMRLVFNPHTKAGQEIAASIRDGFLSAASVSFLPEEHGVSNSYGGSDYGGQRLRVTEVAVCAVPANQTATRAALLLCKHLRKIADDEGESDLQAVRIGRHWCVFNPATDEHLGDFLSREEAEQAIEDMEAHKQEQEEEEQEQGEKLVAALTNMDERMEVMSTKLHHYRTRKTTI